MLPGQWRIAQGIQKSYKKDDATKERRRLYEARRRRLKKEGDAAVDIEVQEAQGQQIENDDGEDNSEDGAFLVDWKSSTSGFMATPVPAQQVLDGNGNYFTQANLGAQMGASYNQLRGTNGSKLQSKNG